MKRPIEREYNSFVSYARELEKYCDWQESEIERLRAEWKNVSHENGLVRAQNRDLRTAAQQALEALNDVEDTVRDYAAETHEKCKGYKPHRHIAVDKDVATVAAAITTLTAALESKNSQARNARGRSMTQNTVPLPEPLCRDDTEHGVNYYTADQMHAYAAKVCAEKDAANLELAKLASDWMDIATAKDAEIERLREALEVLMEWQVKNVKVWHNSAYDYADAALKENKS